MKRLMAMLLAASILLCGCGAKPTDGDTTTQSTTTAPAPQPEPEQDFGIYEPDSTIEQATGGAVKVYNLEDRAYHGILSVGEGLLLFSGDEYSELTYIAPDGTTSKLVLKNEFLYPDNVTVIPERNCVAYYDFDNKEMVLLDTSLKEVERVALPSDYDGEPEVTSDWSRIYYMTLDQLRYLDIETGTDRLLKEIAFDNQYIHQLCFSDTVLECKVTDGGAFTSLFISTQTGELLYTTTELAVLYTSEDRFFAEYYENGINQYLFGTRQGKIRYLNLDEVIYLEAIGIYSLVTREQTKSELFLACYDFATGTRSSAITLPLPDMVGCMGVDAGRKSIWFIAQNREQDDKLYCWNLEQSLTGDETSYASDYHTSDNPDEEGLYKIMDRAHQIGSKYGVRVKVYEDAILIQPSDYTFELQHQVPVYDRYLTELENALAKYPEGFLRKLGNSSDNGRITISLVKGAYGDNSLGSLDSADGVHFYNNGSEYIALVMGSTFERTLYHELFHSIDTYVMSRTNIYDFWEDLNPEGFEYDNDYVANQFRDDYHYLEEDRWFIDMYSMSYAKEDRARIMEYAMEDGNEEYFTSPHMQAKLAKLSEGIRKAFSLKTGSVVLPWEQYLK